MTEQDWLAGTDLNAMLKQIQKRSDRKLRLFQAACCRRVWDWLPAGACRDGVLVAERYADGLAKDRERLAAQKQARAVINPDDLVIVNSQSAVCAALDKTVALRTTVFLGSADVAAHATQQPGRSDLAPYQAAYQAGQQAEARLLHCIFGDPYHSTPSPDPAWLRWRDGTVLRLAQKMYDARDFASMPILADALEEAGCTSGDILEHCRGLGPHVPGCWVVDLLLGKE